VDVVVVVVVVVVVAAAATETEAADSTVKPRCWAAVLDWVARVRVALTLALPVPVVVAVVVAAALGGTWFLAPNSRHSAFMADGCQTNSSATVGSFLNTTEAETTTIKSEASRTRKWKRPRSC